MKKHAESHFDHGLTDAQVDYLMKRFADREAFFIETVELPEDLGTVPCGLFGPIVGDAPVAEVDVTYAKRGARGWTSRLVDRAPRSSRLVTVIAGPHGEHACVVYTAFGGPLAPQEPGDVRRQLEALETERRERNATTGDPAGGVADGTDEGNAAAAKLDPLYAKILGLRRKRDESDAFWREHALAK